MSRVDEAIEAAFGSYGDQGMGAAVETLQAFFRTLYGCEQCAGKGWLRRGEAMTGHGPVALEDVTDCPAKHVTLTILGVEIYAAPAMCMRWCLPHGFPMRGAGCDLSYQEGVRLSVRCREVWVPRPITELETT